MNGTDREFKKLLGCVLGGGFALGDPIARSRLAIALGLGFAGDGIAADFACVFGYDLIALEFACDLERHFVAFDLTFFDGGVVVAAGNGAGDFFAFDFEFEGGFTHITVLIGGTGFPSAVQVGLFVLGACSNGERQERTRGELEDGLEGSLHNVW